MEIKKYAAEHTCHIEINHKHGVELVLADDLRSYLNKNVRFKAETICFKNFSINKVSVNNFSQYLIFC